jgi:hypothetical protein
MDNEVALNFLRARRHEIGSLLHLPASGMQFLKWKRDTRVTLETIFGPQSSHADEFSGINFTTIGGISWGDPADGDSVFRTGLAVAQAMLDSMISELKLKDQFCVPTPVTRSDASDPLPLLRHIFTRFPLFARQLQERREKRSTISFNDEYDVQDALHAILKLHFTDVEPEEPTGKLAGKSSRIDFLLKPERVAIEAKMPRDKRHAKEIGDELIVDLRRYKSRADVGSLICLVYDPSGFIGNPAGVEGLSSNENGFHFEVIVTPKGM